MFLLHLKTAIVSRKSKLGIEAWMHKCGFSLGRFGRFRDFLFIHCVELNDKDGKKRIN